MQFIPNAEEQLLIQLIQKYHRSEYSLVRMTYTMIDKSTIDASIPIKNILRLNGIFEFEDAEDGVKYYRDTIVFYPDSIEEIKTSFYRPKAKPHKKGDPRFWPWGFKKLVAIDTLVYITSVQGRLVLIPLTKETCTQKNLESLFGVLESSIAVVKELFGVLNKLSGMWIKSCSPLKNSPKDVGDTLEMAIGIPVNNKGNADYKGEIELKTKRSSSKTMDTLFSQVPDWELSPINSVREMVLTYGYPSTHEKRRGFYDLFVTVSNKPNPQGLYLEVDYDNAQVLQYYSNGKQKEITSIWKFEKLKQRLNEKHPKTAWVIADEKLIGEEYHFLYKQVELTQNPIFSQFLSLIEQGIITYDWRGGHEVNGKARVDKGHAFRLKSPKYRELLFGESEVFEV
ncbi:hypothetical protein J8M20_10465 [Pseudoalteromonas luteoviolacea]|uniref:MvaI/BcnI family restriction endonuclease n=1 Tax=Pseudoalteromonas luteoviolacea TaxID=43657 RepID=UPI001B35A95D|nr:MvaI/BcnI family restriction endonuclease [Pseudoalteromonas luteoviolacea]MBQ4811762.1 hypothetical protein [Pseudoalteromonas luteoviolacea]